VGPREAGFGTPVVKRAPRLHIADTYAKFDDGPFAIPSSIRREPEKHQILECSANVLTSVLWTHRRVDCFLGARPKLPAKTAGEYPGRSSDQTWRIIILDPGKRRLRYWPLSRLAINLDWIKIPANRAIETGDARPDCAHQLRRGSLAANFVTDPH